MGIQAAPFFQEIIRWDRAIPQYHVGHLDGVAWLEKRTQEHPGLFLGGNAYHGVSLNDCTEQGMVLARKVAAFIQSKTGEAGSVSDRRKRRVDDFRTLRSLTLPARQ